jgi:hypothetical protein
MIMRLLAFAVLLGCLAGCANVPVRPGADHSLATSECTNGDPDLRQAMLGCPN